MPYTVRKRKGEYCVVKTSDPEGKTFGCHKTKKQANEQITAINISEAVRKSIEKSLQSLTNVKLFDIMKTS